MIQGCLAWQRDGLSPPPVVREAAEAYLAAENALAGWIDDCCDRDPNAWASSTALFASWVLWAEKAGEPAGTMKAFTQSADSADSGQAFRLKADSESGRSRTAFR
jgi:putative DNA primase/helicase